MINFEGESRQFGRREFLLTVVGTFFFAACQRRFVRPGGEHQLGQIKDLLEPKTHLHKKALLLYRDPSGWSVMSTVCTFDGCDLTNQEKVLFCSCCNSKFDLRGKVLERPSTENLPWYKLSYTDGNLYADSGSVVDQNYRFTTRELEAEVNALKGLQASEGGDSGSKIPEVLLGHGDHKDEGPSILPPRNEEKSGLDEIEKRLQQGN